MGRKKWHIVAYLRSNWNAAGPDIEFCLEHGWIGYDEEDRTFAITAGGRKQLQEMRPHVDTFFSRHLTAFKRRLGR